MFYERATTFLLTGYVLTIVKSFQMRYYVYEVLCRGIRITGSQSQKFQKDVFYLVILERQKIDICPLRLNFIQYLLWKLLVLDKTSLVVKSVVALLHKNGQSQIQILNRLQNARKKCRLKLVCYTVFYMLQVSWTKSHIFVVSSYVTRWGRMAYFEKQTN